MMAILVAATLGALILPMVIAQNRSTRFDMTRVRALHAAQTGVDVTLGQIRASTSTSTDGIVLGNPSKLPCYPPDAPLTGAANGTGTATYSVSVVYWASNPSDGGRPMICSNGYGTYDTATSTASPRYAVVTSTGKDGAVDSGSQGRKIVSTYSFQTDDTNISGGVIRVYPAGGDQWCMDAGAAVPTNGAAVVLRACSVSTPPKAQQVFAYRSDLSIQLVSSVTTANPNGLCLDTQNSSPSTPQASNDVLVLKTCGVVNPTKCDSLQACSPSYQQWSINDNSHLEGAKADKSTTDNLCINAAAQADGTALTLTGCAGGTADPNQTWVPSPTTGAGMAGAKYKQLVNYRQFATCLDVTGQDPNASYLILYTCKQNPNPSSLTWNQIFTPSALAAAPTYALLKTTTGGTAYCLTSPLSAGGYVRVTSPCPASVTPGAYRWLMNQTQDANGNDLPYAQKYTIVDDNGLCLAPGPNTDLVAGFYLKAIVQTCDGSTSQKWNASSSLDSSRLSNTHEDPLTP